MVSRRPLFVAVSVLAAAVSGGVVPGARAQQATRPLVVVFPVEPPLRQGADKTNQTVVDPAALGRAVRELLDGAKATETIVYSPEAAVFLRAAIEMKRAAPPAAPTPDERLALGKAVGAFSVLSVFAERDKDGSVAVEGFAADVSTGKTWADRAAAQITRHPGANAQNVSARRGLSDDLLSAANTVVAKYLTGPLAPFSRGLSSAAASPPPAANTAPVAEVPAATSVQEAIARGQRLLESGDPAGGFLALRQAVNLAPRDPAPRVALTRAYLAAGRGTEAVAEARRALAVAGRDDDTGHVDLTRLLADSLARAGDTGAAAATYRQIVEARPRAVWARVALADLLLRGNDADGAESQLREALRVEPGSAEVGGRLARLRAARGDVEGAAQELGRLSAGGPARARIVRSVFDTGAGALAASLARTRKAFDEGQLGRDTFERAAAAQAERVNALQALLKTDAADAGRAAHRHRVLAAALLAQAAAIPAEEGGGTRTALLLGECRREIASAQALDAPPPPPPSSSGQTEENTK